MTTARPTAVGATERDLGGLPVADALALTSLVRSGGWVDLPDRGGGRLMVRVADRAGRLEVVSLLVSAPEGGRISSVSLKKLRVAAVEELLNTPVLAGAVRRSLSEGPSALDDVLKEDPPRSPAGKVYVDAGPLRFDVPVGRKPDEFYAAVALRFGLLRQMTSSAATVLAEANNVPASTVYRWLKEAKRRGLMAPAPPRRPRSS